MTVDIRIPIELGGKTPLYAKKFLSIPPSFERHSEFAMPSFTEIFGKEAPVCAEFCSGNGEWVVDRAIQFPEKNWVAVEMRFDRVRKIWARGKRFGVTNLFVVWGDAKTYTEFYLPAHSLERVFVNFPDPWPKRRHAEHRLITKEFVQILSKGVTLKGEFILATDDETYALSAIEILNNAASWKPLLPPPYFTHQWEGFGTSFFQDLWLRKEKKIYYEQFQNDRD
jgi:tRNA (guanine-N7-)-methyltransferase